MKLPRFTSDLASLGVSLGMMLGLLGSLLFGFRGRINRAKYWLAVLIYSISSTALGLVGIVAGQINDLQLPVLIPSALPSAGLVPAAGQSMGWSVVTVVYGLAVSISAFLVCAKRLHDRGKSAWWLLVFFVLPTVLLGIGMGIAVASGSWCPSLLCIKHVFTIPFMVPFSMHFMWPFVLPFFLVGMGIQIWGLVEFGCMRGTIGPNGYGPDPLKTL